MLEYIEELIRMLVTCTQARSLYPAGHAMVQREEDVFYNKLNGLFSKSEQFTIGIVGNEIVFENVPLYKMSISISGFINELKAKGIEKIVFTKGTSREELNAFIDFVSQKTDESKKGTDLQARLASMGIKHIQAEKIYTPGKGKEGESEEITPLANEIYNSGLSAIEDIAKDISKHGRILNMEKIRQVISNLINGILKNKASLLILTSIKKHDEHTFVHAINVSILALIQAESLGFKEEFLNDIGVSALLHDVGKLNIPENILKKDGVLSAEEIQEIKNHPLAGAKILAKTEGLSRLASVVAFEHHLKYDLSGYPVSGYKYEQMLGSMMVNIADYYDACRSHRSYHKGLPPEEIYSDMLKKSDVDFDPDLLRHFFKTIGMYPAGTLVLLDTKEIGMVQEVEPIDPARPRVKLICDENRNKLQTEVIISLLDKHKETGNFKRSIVRSINPFDPENAWLVPLENI